MQWLQIAITNNNNDSYKKTRGEPKKSCCSSGGLKRWNEISSNTNWSIMFHQNFCTFKYTYTYTWNNEYNKHNNINFNSCFICIAEGTFAHLKLLKSSQTFFLLFYLKYFLSVHILLYLLLSCWNCCFCRMKKKIQQTSENINKKKTKTERTKVKRQKWQLNKPKLFMVWLLCSGETAMNTHTHILSNIKKQTGWCLFWRL